MALQNRLMTKPIAPCFALAFLGLTACAFPTKDCTDTEFVVPQGGGPGMAETLLVLWVGAWIYCGVKVAIEGGPTQQRAQMQRKVMRVTSIRNS